jgi:hypothetical protein
MKVSSSLASRDYERATCAQRKHRAAPAVWRDSVWPLRLQTTYRDCQIAAAEKNAGENRADTFSVHRRQQCTREKTDVDDD